LADFTPTVEQNVELVANPKTAAGNPASLGGPLQAEVISGPYTIGASSDPLKVLVVTPAAADDPATPGQIRVFADGDPNTPGDQFIDVIVSVTTVPANAASLGIVGSLVPKV